MGERLVLAGPGTAGRSVEENNEFFQGGPEGGGIGDEIGESPRAESVVVGDGGLEIIGGGDLTLVIEVGNLPLLPTLVFIDQILAGEKATFLLARLVGDGVAVDTGKVDETELVLDRVVVVDGGFGGKPEIA